MWPFSYLSAQKKRIEFLEDVLKNILQDDAQLEELSIKKGEFKAEISGGAAPVISAVFINLFKSFEAPNFLELAFLDRETHEQFLLTIQRQSGLRPTDKIRMLTQSLRQTKNTLKNVTDVSPTEIVAAIQSAEKTLEKTR